MINLIPNEEKKKMTKDFRQRLATLFLLMLSFCVFVACVSILPAYIFSATENSIINGRLLSQENTPLPTAGEQSLAVVKDLNSKLSTIDSAEKNKFSLSDKVVDAIISNKGPNIKITQILYVENDQIQGKKVSITGIASSREALLSFRQSLEDNVGFKDVNLPISNFIKESNIQFSLSLIPS